MTTQTFVEHSEIGSRKSLFKNSSSILLSRIATTSVSLISVPIVVNHLDIIGYGTWESIIAVSVLSNIFQCSISGTLLWKISGAYGGNDKQAATQYVGVGIFFSLLIFFTFTPLAWICRDFIVQLFQIPQEFRYTASVVLPCVVALITLGGINEVVAAQIAGFQKSGTPALIQAASMTCNSLSIIICLLWGFGFWSLLIGFAVGFITYGVGLYASARYIFGSFSLMPRLPQKSMLEGTVFYAGFILLGAISVVLRDQTDKIILSSVASPLWTGHFGIASRLSGLFLLITSFIYVPTMAAAGALNSANDRLRLQQLYMDVMTYMALIVGLSIALMASLYDRVILFWVGRPIPEVGSILYFMVSGNAIAVLLAGTGSSICKGIGLIRLETIYIIVGLIVNLILKIILVLWIGPIGTVISSATSWAVASVVFIVLLHQNIKLPLVGTIRALKGLVIGAACALCGRWLSNQIPLECSRFSAFVSTVELATVITVLFLAGMILCRTLPLSALASGAKFARNKFVDRMSSAKFRC